MKKRFIPVLIALVAAASWLVLRQVSAPAVEIAHPTRGPAVQAVYATGTVEATVMMPIASRTSARLMDLNVDEGSKVTKDQVLARLEDADLQNSVSELQAKEKFASEDYARKAALLSRGFATKAAADQAKADWDSAKAAVSRATAEANYLKLQAPAQGLIIRRDGEIGQLIPANQPVFWLSCCAPLRISAEVDEEDIALVDVGQAVLIRADAFPGKVFHGKVLSITPKGDPVARSYRVRIGFAEEVPLMIGMTAETNIITGERKDALLVPSSALAHDKLWVVKDNKLALQPVTIGARGPEQTEIKDGVTEQDEVVVNPGGTLKAGSRVRTSQGELMRLLVSIALKHLLARKRQSIVSLMGIVLGVAFFLAISSLMQGSEKDFIRRLVDNSPHINIVDEFRNPRPQPLQQMHKEGAVELRSVKPITETRGIRGYEQILEELRRTPGLQASPVLAGQALVSFAGRDVAITLNGMIPAEVKNVSTIENYMVEGTMDELIANPDGIVVGSEMARRLSLSRGDNLTVAATTGQTRTFKILGIFRTGRSNYDESQAFASLKRVQALLNRPNRANSIIIKLPDPVKAQVLAADIESRIGYKSVSWQEASEDIMSTLTIRNIIMYTVVSAVLVVAAFGIYNVISTVVMEKQRDISILKSMGFHASDIKNIFVIQGLLLGITGCITGLPLGAFLMWMLSRVHLKPPGATEMIQMPIDWGVVQFLIAAAFALTAAVLAALLPARKAAHVHPVDILRGS